MPTFATGTTLGGSKLKPVFITTLPPPVIKRTSPLAIMRMRSPPFSSVGSPAFVLKTKSFGVLVPINGSQDGGTSLPSVFQSVNKPVQRGGSGGCILKFPFASAIKILSPVPAKFDKRRLPLTHTFPATESFSPAE